jgi:hypothetical protein
VTPVQRPRFGFGGGHVCGSRHTWETGDQFVNLTKTATFVEDEVKSIERAGALHVEAVMIGYI